MIYIKPQDFLIIPRNLFRKKLLDVIKGNISYEDESATIDTLSLMTDEKVIDENKFSKLLKFA